MISVFTKIQSADEFFKSEQCYGKNKTRHDDYMDFAERYADYVVGYEKSVDKSELSIWLDRSK